MHILRHVAVNDKQATTSAPISVNSKHCSSEFFLHRPFVLLLCHLSYTLAGAAQLDRLADPSNDSTSTAAADSLSHTEQHPLLAELQQQALQAAIMGGVPIEQVSASLLAPTPILAKPLKGPEAVKEAFARLRDLSTAAAGPAKELEVIVLPVGTHYSMVCWHLSDWQQCFLAEMNVSWLARCKLPVSLASQLFVKTGMSRQQTSTALVQCIITDCIQEFVSEAL